MELSGVLVRGKTTTPLRVDRELQALLSQADQALGRLDGAVQILPNADLFVLMFVRREAVLSSQIEGTQSSLRDLLRAEANIFDPERPADVAEVVNYCPRCTMVFGPWPRDASPSR